MRIVESVLFMLLVLTDTAAVFLMEIRTTAKEYAMLGAAAFLACGLLMFLGTVLYNKKLDKLNCLMWPFFRGMAKRHPGVYWKAVGWVGISLITVSLARQILLR